LNWARIAVLSYFARSVSAISKTLQYSILPILDSQIFEYCGIPDARQSGDQEWAVPKLKQPINLDRFMSTQYFRSSSSSSRRRYQFETRMENVVLPNQRL
jgi:hypothetical protein